MSLDSVELVIAIEDEFALEIPDAEAEKIITVGDMFRLIVEALQKRGDPRGETTIWTKLTEIIVEQLGVHPRQVVQSASFVEDLGIG